MAVRAINAANLDQPVFEGIERKIPSYPSLGDMVNWGLRQHPPLTIESVVTPDEYTHDVVMRWRENLYIVLGTT